MTHPIAAVVSDEKFLNFDHSPNPLTFRSLRAHNGMIGTCCSLVSNRCKSFIQVL